MKIVLHIITGLHTGGAERMLEKVITSKKWSSFRHVVLSLGDEGVVGQRLSGAGITVHSLQMKRWGGANIPFSLFRLGNVIRRVGPDIIQGWMYHANMAALAGARMARVKGSVLWNIRHSLYDLEKEKRVTRLMIRLGARWSPRVDAIIYNSQVSRGQHEARGYAASKGIVIPNGFDCGQFAPDGAARLKLRGELGLDQDTRLVGLVARYHPIKDFNNFIRAATKVALRRKDTCFVLVGCGVDSDNPSLSAAIHGSGRSGKFFLLGERSDVPYILAGLDILSVTSWGEAFPNVAGEAMACGTPCVVTDVGDAGVVVGDTGLVVPPKDSDALAQAWLELLSLSEKDRRALGEKARRRVVEKFSLNSVVALYKELYENVLSSKNLDSAETRT